MTCHHCHADHDHCHDVLVVHPDGAAECANPECTLDPVGHEWVEHSAAAA